MDEKQLMKTMEYLLSVKKEEETDEIPFDSSSSKEEKMADTKETALKLKKCFKSFKIENNFKEGQLVSWKKGLKNRKYPEYDEPAIVIKALDTPIYSDTSESGSPYFQEPLDIILGVIVNGDFENFYYDKRRFNPFKYPHNPSANKK